MGHVTRRHVVRTIAVTPVALILPQQSNAALLQLLGIIFRLLIGNGIRAAVKWAVPAALATATRRFLVGVAIAYGISETQAALVAAQAEAAGADTLARGGVHHDVTLSFKNTTAAPVTIRGALLEMVNLETNVVEEVRPLLLNMPAMSEHDLHFTVRRFAGSGLRQLRVTALGQTMAVGSKFWGVAE